ncbi:AbrB/MazE/SpoVT family DNA-binding domain-containing protein [Patescibacteria group bacterium]|nr:MAG: AbrB/MazE/SpoVT family DNA-binding domain-containing protein [Patescibacteria group bacterium]
MRKLEDKSVRTLIRLGRVSLAVTLPAEMRTELGWREGQKVVVKRVKGGVLVKDWKK